MDEERARILKMLEEGKITAPEAEKLLLALKGSPRPDMSRDELRARMRRFGLREMRRMPEMVSGMVSDVVEDELQAAVRKQRLEFESRGKLLVRNVSGDTQIDGWERSTVLFDRKDSGLWKANEREGMIMAKVLSGDLDVKVPHKTNLVVNSVSGDVGVQDVSGKVEVRTVSGDVVLRALKGPLDVGTTSGDIKTRDVEGKCHITTVSGEIDLGVGPEVSGLVETRSGDALLWIPADANLLLEVEIVDEGEIRCQVEAKHEKLEEKPDHLKLGFGEKANRLWVRCRNGDVEVRSYEPAKASDTGPAEPEMAKED